MKEVWRSVEETDGYYDVSNIGRVRRAKPGRGTRVGWILKGFTNKDGYLKVVTYCNGRYGYFFVHRLVASAFLGPCPPGKEVNHKDLNKQNNVPSNLEYVTHRRNVRHAADNGVLGHTNGETNPFAKLTWEKVEKIREYAKAGKYTQKEMAAMFGVAEVSISGIVRWKSWNHKIEDRKSVPIPKEIMKGKKAVGERHWNATLTWQKVRRIRDYYETGDYETKELARVFGVDVSTIGDIVRCKTWKEKIA